MAAASAIDLAVSTIAQNGEPHLVCQPMVDGAPGSLRGGTSGEQRLCACMLIR